MKNVTTPTEFELVDILREQFMAFLASKPTDLYYDWDSCIECACATFIKEELIRHESDEWNEVWRRWNLIAAEHPRTYGALLERIR